MSAPSAGELSFDWGDGSPATVGTSPQSHEYARPGQYTIVVTDQDSGATSECQFTYPAPEPCDTCTLTAVSPTPSSSTCYTIGQTLTLTGDCFYGATQVMLTTSSGPVPLTSVVVSEDGKTITGKVGVVTR